VNPPTVECSARLVAGDLERGRWVVVLRADEIPHVVMLQDGICFSLEHDGNRRYTSRKLWRMIEARRIPALLCELGPEADGPVEAIYDRLERIEGADGDCFVPVRDYCATWFPECAACEYPWQLVPLLSASGKLVRAGTRYLQEDRDGPLVVMPVYDRRQIRARIAEVRRTIRDHGPTPPPGEAETD